MEVENIKHRVNPYHYMNLTRKQYNMTTIVLERAKFVGVLSTKEKKKRYNENGKIKHRYEIDTTMASSLHNPCGHFIVEKILSMHKQNDMQITTTILYVQLK
jgi:hypothetical protein